MINILFIHPHLGNGGAERQLLNILKHIDKSKFRPILILMDKDGERVHEALALNIEVIFVLRKWRWHFSLFQELIKIIKKYNITIVHSWGMMPSFYTFFARIFISFIWINGSIRFGQHLLTYQMIIRRLLLYFADYRVANSLAGLKACGFSPGKKNIVIYNGVESKPITISREALKRKYNITQERVVTSIGRLEDDKDFLGFIDVAERVLLFDADICFLIVGSGSRAKELKDKVLEKGLESNFAFTGFSDNVFNFLNISNVFILLNPPRHGEGFANAISEAMIAGLPVIATDFGGTSEFVENYKTGFLFHACDYAAIADRTIELLHNREEAESIGKAAKKKMIEEFSVSKLIDQYEKLYLRVLEI